MPFLSCIALFIYKAIHDINILVYINYAFYTIIFTIFLAIFLLIFSICFLLAYKAFLILFNIKSINIDKQ